MSTVPGTCSGQRTFKWRLCPPLKVSAFGQSNATLQGNLALLNRGVWLGQLWRNGAESTSRGEKTTCSLLPSRKSCVAHQLEIRGDNAEQVPSIPFEESKWVRKGCLGLGIFTRWYWEECWPWEVLFLLCELTDPLSFLRVCLCPGHVLQLPEFPLLLPGLSGCCFCALHQVSLRGYKRTAFLFLIIRDSAPCRKLGMSGVASI